ncbi:hypothetical protein HPB52_015738 [Rhipicephalus sanguineus]|uniref:Uncharacterized protein n=1 Tax=Rhipicephalus sanguineus TaxID=34632 RepID=A0A9D4PIZ5_RHISA|nr:hypothetical protein HPB52_015738 [Rhipicephalus sanguineus]
MKKAEVDKPAADSKPAEEANGDAAPPAKKAKTEPAWTHAERENKCAGGRRVSSLEAGANEVEDLLYELSHKGSSDQTVAAGVHSRRRGAPRLLPLHGSLHGRPLPSQRAVPRRLRPLSAVKKERELEEEEEAASAEEASTTAAKEDR